MTLRNMVLCAGAMLVLAGATPAADAQQPPRRLNDKNVRELLDRIKDDSERFKHSLDEAVDHSSINGTWEEDEIKGYADKLEDACEKLHNDFKEGDDTTRLVQEVLTRGAVIDHFLADQPLGALAEGDWKALRARLDELASAYGVQWQWRFGVPTVAEVGPRMSDDEMKQLIKRIEESTDRLKDALDKDIDHSALDDTPAETQADALVAGLEKATDRLRDRFDNEDQASEVVGRVLWQAERLEEFLQRANVSAHTRDEWQQLTAQLRDLSRNYGLQPLFAMLEWR